MTLGSESGDGSALRKSLGSVVDGYGHVNTNLHLVYVEREVHKGGQERLRVGSPLYLSSFAFWVSLNWDDEPEVPERSESFSL